MTSIDTIVTTSCRVARCVASGRWPSSIVDDVSLAALLTLTLPRGHLQQTRKRAMNKRCMMLAALFLLTACGVEPAKQSAYDVEQRRVIERENASKEAAVQ